MTPSVLLALVLAAGPAGAADTPSGTGRRFAVKETDATYHQTVAVQRRIEELMARLRPYLSLAPSFKEDYSRAADVGSLDSLHYTLSLPFAEDSQEFLRLDVEFDRLKGRLDLLGLTAAVEVAANGSRYEGMSRDIGAATDLGLFRSRMKDFEKRLYLAGASDNAAYAEARERLLARDSRRRTALWTGAALGLGTLAGGTALWRRRAAARGPRRPKARRPPFSLGAVLDENYLIERELSRDESGVTFEALDLALGRKVALKRLREGTALPERDLTVFLRKARAAACLKHPNIVNVYAIANDGPLPCPVFELVDGDPFSMVLARGPVSLPAAKGLVRQVAAALEHAHGRGVFHGSLQPSSIWVKADGTAKVTDFGMAPREASKEADLYALGACARDLLGPQPSPASEAFVRKALHPDPRQRFRSAAELARAFEGLPA